MQRNSDLAIRLWVAVGLCAQVLLPWYAVNDSAWWQVLPQVTAGADTASGLIQALLHGRKWLLGGLIGVVMCAMALGQASGRAQAPWLIAGGMTGLASLLASGFAIGPRGWSVGLLQAWFGELSLTQYGMGAGAAITLLALLMLLACGLARRGWFRGDLFVAGSVMLCCALLLAFVAFPVLRALQGAFFNEDGQWSPQALVTRLGSERIWGLACIHSELRCGVAWNTLALATLTALGTTVLGTLLALMAERSARRWQTPLKLLALLPIITPPFVVGLGLILLFGRAGVVNQWLEWAFGIPPTRWFYGMFGVWFAQMFAFTPIAFLIMRGVLQGIAPSLEEAAQTLRASPLRTFFSITLPLLKPGLANAFLVGFIESMADFGNPIIVGAQFSVLSTEIFFAIVGAQYDAGRAATLAWVLTAFALAAFALQRVLLGRQGFVTVGGKGESGVPLTLPLAVRRVVHGVTIPWLVFTAVVYLFAFSGGFVQTWGRDYSLTLRHFHTAFALEWGAFGVVFAGTAWQSLFNTLWLAGLAAPLTAALGLLIAWLLARTTFRGQGAFEFAALLAFAIPGTVLGVSYVMAFNVPPIELTGTGLVIVLCFIFRNLPVGVRAGTASLRQIDRSLDEASQMLRASTLDTLRHVVLPLLKPALVAALVYSFARAMTTVSAVIFLVTAEHELATTYIIGRVGNGDYGVALAYCSVLIAILCLATLAIQWLVGERKLGRRPAPASADVLPAA